MAFLFPFVNVLPFSTQASSPILNLGVKHTTLTAVLTSLNNVASATYYIQESTLHTNGIIIIYYYLFLLCIYPACLPRLALKEIYIYQN